MLSFRDHVLEMARNFQKDNSLGSYERVARQEALLGVKDTKKACLEFANTLRL